MQKKQFDFIPFSKPTIGDEEISEVIDTLRSGWLTSGPKTKLFEDHFKAYVGSKHAIAVNSCTAALHLSLIACGIKPGDEVITTPFTFAATANVIEHCGAKPVFVDIDPKTYNIDSQKIEEKITSKTKAIIPVHYAGQPVNLNHILEIARRKNIFVVEDAAHAIGSEYECNKIGTYGNTVCFSFYANKNITTGEGGMVTTNDDSLAEKIRLLSLHGLSKDAWNRYSKEGSWYYEIIFPGYKYNMTDIQASIGLHQLEKIDTFITNRQEIAKKYDENFKEIKSLIIPFVEKNIVHARHLYTIQLKLDSLSIDRALFIKRLSENGVGASVHFIPIHLHPYYAQKYGYARGDFPVCEKVYDSIVSLPLFPNMTDENVRCVADVVKKIILENEV